MSIEEVKELAQNWPTVLKETLMTETDDLLIVVTNVHGPEMASINCFVHLIFNANKLVRGLYIFQLKEAYGGRYIQGFEEFKRESIKAWGSPHRNIQVWKNELYKNERSKWEYAIKVGHMSYFAEWNLPRSIVTLWLTKYGGEIAMMVSVTMKDFYNKIKNKNIGQESFELVNEYWTKAIKLKGGGFIIESVDLLEKLIELEKNSPKPQPTIIFKVFNELGHSYFELDQYEKAVKYFEYSLTYNQFIGKEEDAASGLNNVGLVYQAWGKYDKAIKFFQEALSINKELGMIDNIIANLNNIGSVYVNWGNNEKAKNFLEEAIVICRKNSVERETIVKTLINLAGIYESLAFHEKATSLYEEAMAEIRKSNDTVNLPLLLNNLGANYLKNDNFEKAEKNFKEALAYATLLGQENNVAVAFNNYGALHSSLGQFSESIKFYKYAKSIHEKLRRDADVALSLSNIGAAYLNLGNFTEAIDNLNKSIELKEKIRETAVGDLRRDYLASEISTYLDLTSAYVRSSDLKNAINTIELSRARLLIEQLADSKTFSNIPSIDQVQKGIPEHTLILIYANVYWDNKIIIGITNKNIYGVEVSDSTFVSSVFERYGKYINAMLEKQKKTKDLSINAKRREYKETSAFERVIEYYRNQLVNPTKESGERAKELGRLLYEFVIQPMSSILGGVEHLIIVPDDILSVFPFETLVDKNGGYLVEEYHITYAHSVTVKELVTKRHYDDSREPILAFGGAVYDKVTYSVDMVENESQFKYIWKKFYSALKDDQSTRQVYASLGLAYWDNLPGSLNEVEAIKRVVENAKIIVGSEVSENNIKRLSQIGALAKFKVLHFATHGLIYYDIPELSAIVLSQFKEEKENEDGYLRIDEISKLNIQADFVNLSACETGMGKLYGGEGVVGLAHSFLTAGANALSVSLWRVDDISTSKFMAKMYELSEKQGITYARAVTEVKRQFIKGEFSGKYKKPYYWAPFLYYGEASNNKIEASVLGDQKKPYNVLSLISVFVVLVIISCIVIFLINLQNKTKA